MLFCCALFPTSGVDFGALKGLPPLKRPGVLEELVWPKRLPVGWFDAKRPPVGLADGSTALGSDLGVKRGGEMLLLAVLPLGVDEDSGESGGEVLELVCSSAADFAPLIGNCADAAALGPADEDANRPKDATLSLFDDEVAPSGEAGRSFTVSFLTTSSEVSPKGGTTGGVGDCAKFVPLPGDGLFLSWLAAVVVLFRSVSGGKESFSDCPGRRICGDFGVTAHVSV